MFYLDNASWIPFAPALPAPIARITVAAPVTASPPANTNALEVCPLSSSATMHFLLFDLQTFCCRSNQWVRRSTKRHDHCIQVNIILRSRNLNWTSSSGCIRLTQVPSSQLSYLSPNRSHLTRISFGLVRRSKMIPSSFAW